MFGLMTMAVSDDVRSIEPGRWASLSGSTLVESATPFVLPAVVVFADPAELAAAEAMDAAERAALAVALVPSPIREASVQLRKASAVSQRVSRVSRVSLRLPYYAFGPDPVGGSK
jgi:hypothetical protein